MKNRLCLLGIIFAVLVGCSSSIINDEKDDLESKGVTQVVLENVAIKLLSANNVKEIQATLKQGEKISLMDSDYEFVEFIIEIDNKSDKEITTEMLNIEIKGENVEEKTVVKLESKNHDKLLEDQVISSKEKYYAHVFTSVKKGASSFDYQIIYNGKEESISESFDNLSFKQYKLKDVLKTESFELEIQKKDVVKEIFPSNKDNTYTYFKVDRENESFLVFEINLKNNCDKDIFLEDVFTLSIEDINVVGDFSWFKENTKDNKLDSASILKSKEEGTFYYISVISGSELKSMYKASIGFDLYEVWENK